MKNRLKNSTRLTNIYKKIYKRKYSEHSEKNNFFCTKLIFKTKDQQCDFIISFEGMPENFNPFVPNAFFLYPLKTSENLVFRG